MQEGILWLLCTAEIHLHTALRQDTHSLTVVNNNLRIFNELSFDGRKFNSTMKVFH